MTRVAAGQRGLSESVQWAALGAALLAALLALIESGLVLNARTVAARAALTAAQAQAVWRAPPDVGRRAAADTAARGGLADVDVAVTVNGGFVTVRVRAAAPTLVGWVEPRVQAEATYPLEVP